MGEDGRVVFGGVDTHRGVPMLRRWLMAPVGSWERHRWELIESAMSNWKTGCGHRVALAGWGWRALAATAPA